MAKDFKIVAKVAKFRQIWSHCQRGVGSELESEEEEREEESLWSWLLGCESQCDQMLPLKGAHFFQNVPNTSLPTVVFT